MTDAAEDVDEEIVAKVSDYIDGALAGADRADVGKKIESDPAWKTVYDEMQEARKAISAMRKARAPETFTQDFARNMNVMSKGRFFGRKTFGDRVPFGVLVILAVLAVAVVGYLMWSSQTGSLKVDHHKPPPQRSGEGLSPLPH
jgi:anti-sigma factor RsiW